MRLVARLAVPVLALAVTLPAYAEAGAPSAPARADHSSRVQAGDGSHDVWFIDDGFARERRRIDPGRAVGDITSLRVGHRLSSVSFTLKERALQRPGKRDLLVTPLFLIKTSAPARYLALVFSVKNLQQGVAGLVSYQDGDFVDCDGITSRIRYRAGTVRITVPRSCLGNPRWVRTQAATMYQFAQSYERSYVDVAPGRRLLSRQKTAKAFAPAGAVTRPVALRTAPGHRRLAPDLARLMRSIHFLR